MPSTFSPALRLELIGNGEQAANWGNTTNTNLGTLLEQAISGVSSVAFPSDANYNLVSGNGVSDEARNAVLVMTGTLSATRDLIVPTSNKFYAVRNATTGGQSILVKTSAGTGVTLANGFTQLMYCDGTNVVLASVPINSTNGNVVVGGDLAVAGAITAGGGIIMPTGSILEYGGAAAPAGWLLCDGAAVSRATYASLFAILGTAYGVGDGSTTFNVPNRVDRFGVGAGGLYARGSTGGSASGTTSSAGSHNHTGAAGGTAITTAQMPSHNHTGTTSTNGDHSHNFNGLTAPAQGSGFGYNIGSGVTAGSISGTNTTGAHNHTFTTDLTGSGATHNHTISTDGTHDHAVATVPPYVASNYIIKI
jgi:microcystin-dependent protein